MKPIDPILLRVLKGRESLVRNHPFFATKTYSVEFIEDNTQPTYATNGKVVKYNRTYVDKQTFPHTEFCVAHEIGHLLLLHHLRRNGRDFRDWNISCDQEVNILLYKAGFKVPQGAYLDFQYDGWTAEQIYNAIHKEKPEDEEVEQQRDDTESGDSTSEEDDTASGDSESESETSPDGDSESETSEEESEDEGETGTESEDAESEEGMGASTGSGPSDNMDNNRAQESESGESTEINPDDIDGSYKPGMLEDYPDDNIEQEKENIKITIQQGLQAAKRAGKMPNGLEELFQDILTPQLPYKEILNRFITEHSQNDYTWNKPNKKYIPHGLYMPSLDEPTLGDIVVYFDTSGSMWDVELMTEVTTEIAGIAAAYKSKIYVVYVDDRVAGVEVFEPNDEIKLNVKGGGGTSYLPGFKYVEDEDINPVVAIYYTDGYCADMAKEPEYPVLWILAGNYVNNRFNPIFGDVIKIK